MSAQAFRRTCCVVSLTILFSFLLSREASSQTDPDSAMHRLLTATRLNDCLDYIRNGRRLIPELYSEGKVDSVEAIVDFVNTKCALKPFQDFQLLSQIRRGKLSNDWCDDSLVAEITLPHFYSHYDLYERHNFWPTPSHEYNSFIERLASEVKDSVDATSVANAIATYYAAGRDSLLHKLSKGTYQGSCIQARYDREIDTLLEKRRNFANNWSLNAGAWIPDGNLKWLGSKIEIGCQAGLRSRHYGADVTFFARFPNSQQPYLVNHRDSLYETDNFFGMYFGLDPVLRVYSSWNTSLEFFGGIGWDGIMALTADDLKENQGDYLNSLNLNLGFTLRLFYGPRHTRYWGLQARYNFLNYDTDGGTDLSGNSLSINLIWGAMGHGWTDDYLESLHYFDRR
ncbi:MAG: hypothetical protein AB1690_10235 [Candidatus Zixiibacteriota bacterium]